MSSTDCQQEAGVNIHTGFKGIEYFDIVDRQKRILISDGDKKEIGNKTVILYPQQGVFLYLETVETNGQRLRTGFGFNLRKGQYVDYKDIGVNPQRDQELIDGLKKIERQTEEDYLKQLKYPHGYLEVKKLLEPVWEQKLSVQDIHKGDWVIMQRREKIKACHVSNIEEASIMGIQAKRVLSANNPVNIVIDLRDYETKYEPCDNPLREDSFVEVVLQEEFDNAGGYTANCWKIDENIYRELEKYTFPIIDPSEETILSREEYTIAVALDAMAYERWGASQPEIVRKNPGRYSEVSKENYRKAID